MNECQVANRIEDVWVDEEKRETQEDGTKDGLYRVKIADDFWKSIRES